MIQLNRDLEFNFEHGKCIGEEIILTPIYRFWTTQDCGDMPIIYMKKICITC